MKARLFTIISSMEARKLMSYRADFWFGTVLTFVVQIVVAYFLWGAIFRESGDAMIGGFTFRGMMLYCVMVALVEKFIFIPGAYGGFFSQEIYQGGLNRYLIYPTDFFLFKYAQVIGTLLPVLLQSMVGIVAVLFFLDLPPEVNITPQTIAMTVVSLWMANLVSFMIFVPLELVAFWADNVWSLGVMGRMIVVCLGGMMFPLTLFPLWAQELSRWLPFAYTFHFPVATLMGRVSFQEWIFGTGIAAAWCFLFSAIITLIWKRGMLRYTGVGI